MIISTCEDQIIQLPMPTQEYYYIGFHSSCASADEKYANYEAGEAAGAVNSLRESCSSDDTES